MKYFHWISRRIRVSRPKRKTSVSKKYLKHKESARKLVAERLVYFNQHYKYKIGKVAIRNQKRRWGSCSSLGNLNFNYKIVLLPQHLSDYIIVHELCHLAEFNHSQKFWDLVKERIEDYEKCASDLRKIKV